MVYENVRMIISLPTKRVSVISRWKTCIRVLPTRWRWKPAGIEITSPSPCVYWKFHDVESEKNYITARSRTSSYEYVEAGNETQIHDEIYCYCKKHETLQSSVQFRNRHLGLPWKYRRYSRTVPALENRCNLHIVRKSHIWLARQTGMRWMRSPRKIYSQVVYVCAQRDRNWRLLFTEGNQVCGSDGACDVG